jgi:hypothetical protein
MIEIKLKLCAICLDNYPKENNIITPYLEARFRSNSSDITAIEVKSFETAFAVEADVDVEWQVGQKQYLKSDNNPVMNLFYLETVEERNYNVQLWNNCQDSYSASKKL